MKIGNIITFALATFTALNGAIKEQEALLNEIKNLPEGDNLPVSADFQVAYDEFKRTGSIKDPRKVVDEIAKVQTNPIEEVHGRFLPPLDITNRPIGTKAPSLKPSTANPTTKSPSSLSPTYITLNPTGEPTISTMAPSSKSPTRNPTFKITTSPTDASITITPTSLNPTATDQPTKLPTKLPTIIISGSKSPTISVIDTSTNPPTSREFTLNPATGTLSPTSSSEETPVNDALIYGIAFGSLTTITVAALAYYNKERIAAAFRKKEEPSDEFEMSPTTFNEIDIEAADISAASSQGVKITPENLVKVTEISQNSAIFLEKHTRDLQEMVGAKNRFGEAQTALSIALQTEKSQKYYLGIIRRLNALQAASLSIDSDYVTVGQSGMLGGVGYLVKIAGGLAPMAGGLADVLSDALENKGQEIQKKKITKLAKLCPSPVDMDSISKAVASALVQLRKISKTGEEEADADVAKMMKLIFENKELTANIDPSELATKLVAAVLGRSVPKVEVVRNAVLFSSVNPVVQMEEEEVKTLKNMAKKEQDKSKKSKKPTPKEAKQNELKLLQEVIKESKKDGGTVNPSTILGEVHAKSLEIKRSKSFSNKKDQITESENVAREIIKQSGIDKDQTILKEVSKVIELKINTSSQFRELLINCDRISGPMILGASLGKAVTDKTKDEKLYDTVKKWIDSEIGKNKGVFADVESQRS
ncbi:MAG: hypothetical protein ACJAZX_000225 [Rickettsiales bacterium]|jgi:hypothetical protein